MSFNPNQNHSITLTKASVMTKEFRDSNPNSVIGGFFGKDAILSILNQSECVGLKYYFAIENDELTLVVCGAKANQDDLHEGHLAEDSLTDPPYSGTNNPLNS